MTLFDNSDESDSDANATRTAQKRSMASGSVTKLADIFSPESNSNSSQNGTTNLHSSVSFKYRDSKDKVRKSDSMAKSNKSTKSESSKGVIYQDTVQLFQYQEQNYVPVGNVGVALLGDVNVHKFNLIVFQSKQKPLVHLPVEASLVVTPQTQNYVCFYDQQRRLWYLLFNDTRKMVSFCMHVLICKSMADKSNSSSIQYLDVIAATSDSAVAVQSNSSSSKVQIKYEAFLVEECKVGKLLDSNTKDESKLLTIDLTPNSQTNVISGVKKGLIGMKQSSTRVLFIPPKLGYGSNGVKNRVPPNSYLIYEIRLHNVTSVSAPKHSKKESESSSNAPPLPKLPANQEEESEPLSDEDEEDDDETQGDEEDASGGDSSTTNTNEDQSTSSKSKAATAKTRAKLLEKTAKLGQPVFPSPSRNSKAARNSTTSVVPASFYKEPMNSSGTEMPLNINTISSNSASFATASSSSQLALYNPNAPSNVNQPNQPQLNHLHHQQQNNMAATNNNYPSIMSNNPYNSANLPYSSQQSTIFHSQPTSTLMMPHQPFGAQQFPLGGGNQVLDQSSSSSNLQLVMIESKQIQNDVRNQVMQVSNKIDQVQQKVEVLAARDTPFGTGPNQVSMEAAVLIQNIQRIVQENERLKKEADQSRLTNEAQTEKIASLLAQNQKYLEQSNIMLEQRNESFQSVSSASQIKITQLEQEKTQMLNELNSLNNKISELQYDLSTQKQRQVDFKAQLNEEAVGKNQMREDLAASKNKITELEEDVTKFKQAYREQRSTRKAAESKIAELEEQLTDSKSEIESLNRQINERKRRGENEKQIQEKEIDDLRKLHEAEIETWKCKLDQHRKQGSELSLALTKLENELEAKWKDKYSKLEQTRHSLEQQLKSSDERAENLQEELASSKSVVQEVKSALNALQRELKEAKTIVQDKEDEISKLEKTIENLQNELEESAKTVTPEILLPEVKKIMNVIFQVLMKHILNDSQYMGSSLLSFMKLVIKDVTLSVSSGEQPKCLTDSAILIQPVVVEESEAEDDNEDGSEDNEDSAEEEPTNDEKERRRSTFHEEIKPNFSVDLEAIPTATDSAEVINKTRRLSKSSALESQYSYTSEKSTVEENVLERAYQSAAPGTAQFGSEFKFETDKVVDSTEKKEPKDSDVTKYEKTENGVVSDTNTRVEIDESQNQTPNTEARSSLSEDVDNCAEDIIEENSDPEDTIVLDPRNIPDMEDSDVDGEIKPDSEDERLESEVVAEEKPSTKAEIDAHECPEEGLNIVTLSVGNEVEMETEDPLFVHSNNDRVESVEDKTSQNTDLQPDLQNTVSPSPPNTVDSKLDDDDDDVPNNEGENPEGGPFESVPVEHEKRSSLEVGVETMFEEGMNKEASVSVDPGDLPPPLPDEMSPNNHSGVEVKDKDTESMNGNDKEGSNVVMENDRVIGGSSLPAFRADTPTSENSENEGQPSPVVETTTATHENDNNANDEIVQQVSAQLPTPSADAKKSSKLFEDSDSDDSLFGNSLKVSDKPKTDKAENKQTSSDKAPKESTNINDVPNKNESGDVKSSSVPSTNPTPKKNLTPLFPSDDEDEELDWLK